jgi:DNA mismatch repair protein MutS
MKQYLEQKAQVGDAILFFRMGDFYELFYEDAKVASRVLGLALTSRNKGENPVPLAGVPFHAVESYLARMVKAGYKVAISEQVEDPKLAKGVVRRQIVRIVTPGTLTENIMLDDREGNYLASCFFRQDEGGVAWVELSTGISNCRRAR